MTPADRIECVAVVGGGGLMGSGIAQVVATAGLQVTMVDVDEAAVQRGRRRVERGLDKLVAREKLSEAEAEAARGRLATSTDLEAAGAAADHVVETVIEDFDAKADVLRRLDAVCRDDVIFASNTSQFPISRLAGETGRPDRVIGSHWFNPPPVMRLIEVIRGLETSDGTLQTTLDLARRYGKQTVVCKKDTPGFITSRLIALLMVEAARIVDEGIADVADVNLACQLGFGHAQGPLDTADLSGLDTVARVSDSLRDQYGERFLPPQVIRSLVNAGHYGRKTGRGFSAYDGVA
ncbi:MAG: 3-hydroxyacyl-CoA dehydrogenase family protein [Conexibacter sp.]|nr:3-hydroxyacyl-CoA dehydrogenase family protein [Conexibacter sp.]